MFTFTGVSAFLNAILFTSGTVAPLRMFCLLQHLDVTLLEQMNSAFSDVCNELLQW